MSQYRKEIETTEELAAWYDRKYADMGDGWAMPAEVANAHLDDLGVPFDESKWLLDVGCGAGHFLAEARKRVKTLGIDISVKAVGFAHKRGVRNVVPASIELAHPDPNLGDFDYIVSMGSLEHVVDIDKALDNIRLLLKNDGKFYFFCPNEHWKHFDQPNERTMTDEEWEGLFARHGLFVHTQKRWNDSTAFIGARVTWDLPKTLPPKGEKLNIGSGQRRFDNNHGWINVDVVSRPPDQVPDLVCDVGVAPLPYSDSSMEMVVLHQVYEHFGLGEGHGVIREANRVLKPGGSLIITVPDMRALAQRWLMGQLEDYLYFVNVYGAYQGEPGDRHKFGYTREYLNQDLKAAAKWTFVKAFNWRSIAGADIARDWWILGLEAVK